MTAFDQFQLATVLLGEGDRKGAVAAIQEAIDQIDRDGVDAHMRDDLVSYRSLLLANSNTIDEGDTRWPRLTYR